VSILKRFILILPVAAWLCGAAARAQHAHVNAGALAPTQGSQLYFGNGASFITNSLFIQPLNFTNAGPYAGFYHGTITFAALSGSPFTGGPATNAALPGSQLRLRFVSVAGPAGGSFGVWDVDGFNYDENEAETLTFSLPVGTTNGTNTILLSENNGEPGADPFGHIHGRHYSATQPGLYVVGLQIIDTSANGPGGGPLHAPSDIFPLYFQAGFTVDSFLLSSNQTVFTFGAQSGRTYHLEAATNLTAPTVWTNVDGPLSGNNRLRTLTDTAAGGQRKFYRVRQTQP
jgi:hypothetical protein